MYDAGNEVDRMLVFDTSLLTTDSLALVQALLEEDNLTFTVTLDMLKIFRELDTNRGLLRLWDIDTRYAEWILNHLYFLKFFERVKVVNIEDLPEKEYLGLLEDLIREKEVAPGFKDFLADEICLALTGYPILCTASSRWKIIEFFEKIGAKVRRTIHMRAREKGIMLRTSKFRNMVLAMGLKVAFVHVFAGPLVAFTELGGAAIILIVVDG